MDYSAEVIVEPFLQGGGEMGALTRAYNWAETSVGAPYTWPQSLRTAVSMILSSRFPMFLWWGEDLVQFYNDAYRPSMGNNGKHPLALGQKGEECWPEIWHIIHPLIRQVLTTGEPTWHEDQLIPIFRNGKIEDVYWTFSYSPVRGESGSIQGVLVICTETTDKVITYKRQENANRQFRDMVMQAPIAIAVFRGSDFIAETVNNAYLPLVGKTREEFIDKPLFESLPETRHLVEPMLKEVMETGVGFSINDFEAIINRNGQKEVCYFNAVWEPLRDNNGYISGVIVVAHDITERKKAENALKESAQQVRSIIESAPFPIAVYEGKEMRIAFANQAIMDVWGKGSNVIGKLYSEILPELENQAIFNQVAGVLDTGIPFHARNQRVDIVVNGILQPYFFNYSFTPLYDISGKVYGVMNTGAEVTDLNVAKQKIEELVAERTKELAEANKNLQRSNAELEQFAYIASHDLQEPVRKVSTFTQMLESSLDNIDERSKGYLDKINNASTRMLTLIRDILAYSKLSKETIVFSQVDIARLIENIKTDFELLIEQKHAVINYTGLPVIEAIPLQMSQLFSNLVSNALKYTQPDIAPIITITMGISTAEEIQKLGLPNNGVVYYHIEFQDNGIGFNQENAGKIFHIFQRLHAKSAYSGTGIGLAICKKIAQNHQGEIYATSHPGKGSVFHVILPEKQTV